MSRISGAHRKFIYPGFYAGHEEARGGGINLESTVKSKYFSLNNDPRERHPNEILYPS